MKSVGGDGQYPSLLLAQIQLVEPRSLRNEHRNAVKWRLTVTYGQNPPVQDKSTNVDDDLDRLCLNIARRSYCSLAGDDVRSLLLRRQADALDDWPAFQKSWDRLSIDDYMADGGRYRRRRYATLRANRADRTFEVETHQPHYQSTTYNTLNGGVKRYFDTIENQILRGQSMTGLLTLGNEVFSRLSPFSDWHVEVHQFRIEVNGSVATASPTPEGKHRDGVSFAMMVMIDRSGISGGESLLYNLEGTLLDRLTLTDPLDLLIVNDERVFHGVSDISPFELGQPGYRDVLVATFRYMSNLEPMSN
jgi:hypothetical protein